MRIFIQLLTCIVFCQTFASCSPEQIAETKVEELSLNVDIGSPEAVAAGWVSNTFLESHAEASIFAQMAEAEPRLEVGTESHREAVEG